MKTIFAFLLAFLLLMPLAALGETTDELTLFVAPIFTTSRRS